jgi:hypothetical protein
MKVDLKNETFESMPNGGPQHNHPGHGYYYQITGVENVAGSLHSDKITGDNLANLLNGREGHDELNGGQGSDTLFGEIGNDILNGGAGADKLTGGAGADTFVFASQLDSYWIAGKPSDQIMDFQKGTDKIDLSALGLAYGDLTMMNNQMIDGENYSYFGSDGNDNGILEIGEFSVAVKIAPGTTLSAGDFLF